MRRIVMLGVAGLFLALIAEDVLLPRVGNLGGCLLPMLLAAAVLLITAVNVLTMEDEKEPQPKGIDRQVLRKEG